MPFHVLFGLAGFFFGIVLYVYLFTILVKRREKRNLELTLLFLIGGLLLWYLGNFLSLLLRQMDTASLAPLLGSLEGSAYLGLSLLPALLLHTHWAYYRRHYRLGRWEKPVFGFILLLLYVQLIFLPQALANFLRWPALLSNEIAIALERCQLLESKLQTERELAQKSYMEDLGRMAATVAHNVRNPLSSMKTLMQLLQEAENITPAQEKEITMMIREIDRLSKTVTSLLKFSRREQPASLTEVNLEQLLESLKSLFRGDLQARQLRLQAELQLSSPTLRSNSDFLIDILSNLLSNAIEASSPGDTIRIQVARKDSQVQIIVEDEGPGIPPHIRENLFQPFVTTRAQGTGLGLAIVRQRADQLGGRLEVFSPATHKGTRFVLNLPSE